MHAYCIYTYNIRGIYFCARVCECADKNPLYVHLITEFVVQQTHTHINIYTQVEIAAQTTNRVLCISNNRSSGT